MPLVRATGAASGAEPLLDFGARAYTEAAVATVDLTYVALAGGLFGPGLCRDRDQLAARLGWTFR